MGADDFQDFCEGKISKRSKHFLYKCMNLCCFCVIWLGYYIELILYIVHRLVLGSIFDLINLLGRRLAQWVRTRAWYKFSAKLRTKSTLLWISSKHFFVIYRFWSVITLATGGNDNAALEYRAREREWYLQNLSCKTIPNNFLRFQKIFGCMNCVNIC